MRLLTIVRQNNGLTGQATALECSHVLKSMKLSITNPNWMPKRAAWLRKVACAHPAGGGRLNA